MTNDDAFVKAFLFCTVREEARKETAQSPSVKKEEKAQQSLVACLQETGASRDFAAIIRLERMLVKDDLVKYSNHKAMDTSLNSAMRELDVINRSFDSLNKRPDEYKRSLVYFEFHKNLDGEGLPKDAARSSFRAHDARLIGHLKVLGETSNKDVITARQKNLRLAETIYIERQRHVLEKPVPESKKILMRKKKLLTSQEKPAPDRLQKAMDSTRPSVREAIKNYLAKLEFGSLAHELALA